MALIKEPLEIDFFVDPKSLTKEEKEAISNYIKEYKLKLAKHKKPQSKKRKKSSV